MKTAECVVDAKAELGEGPSWNAELEVLYWVDIEGKKLMIYDPAADKNEAISLDQYIGAAVPKRDGGLILAMQHGFYEYDLNNKKVEAIHDPEENKPNNRFNDGKCDPFGRFWAGTMSFEQEEGEASLYRLHSDHSVYTVVSNLTISNGLAWSKDGAVMYFIDTPAKTVYTMNIDPLTGVADEPVTAFVVPDEEGPPDGMTIDSEGKLWIAHFGEGQVIRWDPESGKALEKIKVPVSVTTSCTFGGKDLKDLYITTGSSALDEEQKKEQPQAGGLFKVRVDVKGTPTYYFGD